MCIFVEKIKKVSDTKIFCGNNGTHQLTVYQMDVKLTGANAMVLPVPVDSPEKISLVDMSDKKDFFTKLEATFPRMRSKGIYKGMMLGAAVATLEVHEVGDFYVSLAGCPEDINRVDPELFQMAPGVQEMLQASYAKGFCFVIAVLKSGGEMHPLAYTYPVSSQKMFIPTKHEHGHQEENPVWEHEIYLADHGRLFQDPIPENQTFPLGTQSSKSHEPSVAQMEAIFSSEALRPFAQMKTLSKLTLEGSLKNIDLRSIQI